MKLIVNTSGRPFLASDAHVILHNRLYGQSGAAAVGLANSGLQIFVPLGPRRALIMSSETTDRAAFTPRRLRFVAAVCATTV